VAWAAGRGAPSLAVLRLCVPAGWVTAGILREASLSALKKALAGGAAGKL